MKGYVSNAKECTDIDECAEGKGCQEDENSICVNTFGSYECQCKPGMAVDSTGKCMPPKEEGEGTEEPKAEETPVATEVSPPEEKEAEEEEEEEAEQAGKDEL